MADYENDNGRYAGMYLDLVIIVRPFNRSFVQMSPGTTATAVLRLAMSLAPTATAPVAVPPTVALRNGMLFLPCI
jgi:hypothetical protein